MMHLFTVGFAIFIKSQLSIMGKPSLLRLLTSALELQYALQNPTRNYGNVTALQLRNHVLSPLLRNPDISIAIDNI